MFNDIGVLLIYFLRDNDFCALPDTVFESLEEKRIACTPHKGRGFTVDNTRVWVILQPLLINGGGYSYVRPYEKKKDGRKAWKALLKHYMGDGPIGTEKSQAYDSINNARYTGESSRFTFEDFVSNLQNAFFTLAEYGEPVAEGKKVKDFVDKIQVTNQAVTSALAHVQADPAMLEDFARASDYVAKIVQRNKTALTRRNVKSFDTKKKGKKGKDKKGQKKPKVELRSYSKKEWQSLSAEDQDKVRKLREEAKKKRKLAALEKDDSSDSDSDTNAGNQMSRKKSKKGN